MNIIIVDDEQGAVNSLEFILTEYCSEVNIIGKAFNVLDAIKEIQNKKPDLVFLDINLPHGTGFDVLESIPDRTFEVIFVTAYSDYAIKAIRAIAADYIMKPIDNDELISAVEKVKIKINEKKSESNKHSLQISNPNNSLPQRIAIPALNGIEFVNSSDIIRLEAEGSYSNIILNNSKKIICSKNLKEFQCILKKEIFFRAHNSHIINLLLVKRFLKNESMIEMCDGSIISLSRRHKDEFVQRMEMLAK